MLFFDVLILLAFAKGAVMLLEDASYSVRGKQSPRQRERAAHQAAERAAAASGQPAPPPPGGMWGRTKAAVGSYLAGVVEDATAKARARKRRAQARRDGNRAIDGIFLDFAEDEGFYSDCDICGWSSRRYRIEANALAAGREHTRTEHPEHYHPDPTPEDDQEPDSQDADADGEAADPTAGGDTEPAVDPATGRPQLKLITGWVGDEEPAAGKTPGQGPTAPGAKAAADSTPAAGDAQASDHEAACTRCNWLQTGLTAQQAQAVAAAHTCPPSPAAKRGTDVGTPAAQPSTGTTATASNPSKSRRCISGVCEVPAMGGSPYCWQHEAMATSRCAYSGSATGRCSEPTNGSSSYCEPHDLIAGARCHFRAEGNGNPCGATTTGGWLYCEPHLEQRRAARRAAEPADDLMTLADATQDSGAGTPAGTGQKNTEGSTTVNLEAMGADEIRAAFTQAITEVDGQHDELDGLAKGLAEAADEYENRQMAATTVTEIREASEAAKSGVTQLAQAKEHLESALADFNAKDGAVADVISDVGNLADRSVLVGG